MLRKNFTKFQETLKKKVTTIVTANEDAQQSDKEKSKTDSLKTDSETDSNSNSSQFSDDPETITPLKKKETLKNGY